MPKSVPLLLVLVALSGCVRKTVDRFTTQRVVPTALRTGDVDRVCKIGEALGHPLQAATAEKNPPDRAMIIADAVAGICDEARAFAHQADGVVAQTVVPAGAGRVAAVKDALALEERSRERAALRFHSAWKRSNRVFGELGADSSCPRVRERDELTLLVGLVSGTIAMLNDKASGGRNAVPLDTLSRVGRVAPCLDDATWWGVPSALQASAWIVVPGSGPEGVDPWAQLREAAERGEKSGVRLGWALYAEIADNADEPERVREAVKAYFASEAAHPRDPDYAMLDEYGRSIVLHQSDLIWAAERGHRTPRAGELPTAPSAPPTGDDPFAPADDPFGADPFAEDATDGAAPEAPAPTEAPE
ncbi:MAG: hypothetical protein H6737_07510 [Alphaproteobacteria bacterium]|nr:hypothetical protein [Alphaproteobacteria bacterium]